MQVVIPVKTNSTTHDWIEKGVRRHGKNYRHQHQGKFYKIVDWSEAERGLFELVLEPVI